MKSLVTKSLLGLGAVVAAVAATATIAIPVVYWLSEGFTRWS
jgi:hypothetical protein